MTAAEIESKITAVEKSELVRRAELYKANEILAFNIGALILTAFNSPRRFPKTPEEAFGRKENRDWRAEKADFSEIARQLNSRMDIEVRT